MTAVLPKKGALEITTGADGAPKLKVVLDVDTATNAVKGQARFEQVTDGEIEFLSSLQGNVQTTGQTQTFTLQGSALPPLPGAKHITTLTISLTSDFGDEGTANYSYFNDTPNPVTLSDQPVKAKWLEVGANGALTAVPESAPAA